MKARAKGPPGFSPAHLTTLDNNTLSLRTPTTKPKPHVHPPPLGARSWRRASLKPTVSPPPPTSTILTLV
ncbi:hypothetical protein ACAM_0746 [Aeropyrum camini SY1 = JCM 12091]|uniref:Uncharacterized protein n=1 Tax=Aeropyrum camini SY1 = JCM 12091 TaxID=1198449 RepID=U3TDW1_9CREN|nr:hypothetical protein ACAM_0746 [Aeropyrum camini SY1 = JCM 12091]